MQGRCLVLSGPTSSRRSGQPMKDARTRPAASAHAGLTDPRVGRSVAAEGGGACPLMARCWWIWRRRGRGRAQSGRGRSQPPSPLGAVAADGAAFIDRAQSVRSVALSTSRWCSFRVRGAPRPIGIRLSGRARRLRVGMALPPSKPSARRSRRRCADPDRVVAVAGGSPEVVLLILDSCRDAARRCRSHGLSGPGLIQRFPAAPGSGVCEGAALER